MSDPAGKSGGAPNRMRSGVVSDPMSAVTAEDLGASEASTRRGRSTSSRPGRSDFDELFDANYARLVRSLSLVAGDAESAADAVQEAFVKAHLRWRKIGAYDDPIGWVRRVAINRLRDDHRRRTRKERALGRLARRSEVVAEPAELDEFGRLLAELPTQQRATTALFYVDGLTVAEIADALGIAEGSVKSHLFDARKRLRPVLERERALSDGPLPPAGERP